MKTSRSLRWGIGLFAILLAAAGVFWIISNVQNAPSELPRQDAEVIKILVNHEGVYRVSADDLERFGWTEIQAEKLSLTYHGAAYPFITQGKGEQFELFFFGLPPQPPFDRYTPTSAYFLTRTQTGSPMSTLRDAEPGFEALSVVETALRLEENRLYSPKLEEGRPWFWLQIPAPGSQSVSIDIPHPAQGEAVLRFDWFGSTSAGDIDPDHHLIIRLNETLIADEYWDGSGPHLIEARIDTGLLNNGENTLQFELPGDTGVFAEIVLLDSITVQYPAETASTDAGLRFTATGDAVVFNDSTLLLDISRPLETVSGQIGRGSFSTTPGNEYFAVPRDAVETPAAMLAADTETDYHAIPGADYLVIGAPDLLAVAQPLLDYRSKQGLVTLAVPLEAVYNQFGNGLATPHAIRSFLAFAKGSWENPPEYVLLLGDWSYDPYGYISPIIENGLPSFLTYAQFGGETVSDVEIAKLDDDDLPDIALGRIPARNAEQLQTVIDKIIAFEAATWPEESGRRILAIADPTEASFKDDAKTYLAGFDERFSPVLIAPGSGGENAPAEIEAQMNNGVLLMSYFGHGSLTQLGKDDLFTVEQAAALQNGDRTPIMINITCLAGLFTHPSVESLSEVMLWNPDGGAVAGLSATSLTLPVYQAFLSSGLTEELVASPGSRLGDILLAAQRQIPVEHGTPALEVLDTFLLFGDPGLLMP